jgi:hypothetical protein
MGTTEPLKCTPMAFVEPLLRTSAQSWAHSFSVQE